MVSYTGCLVTLLLTINAASALRCYACEGIGCKYGWFSFAYPEVECNLHTDSSFLNIVSSVIPSQCVKLVGTDQDGNTFVARNCTVRTGEFGCNLASGITTLATNLRNMQCYTCTTDLCNIAPGKAVSVIAAIFVACIVFLF